MLPMSELEMKKQIQDISLIFWTLILPVLFIIGFMTIFSDGNTDKSEMASQIVTGFNVFFSFFIIISIVYSFVKDKEKGLVARLASTKLTPMHFFIGKCLPFVIIVFAQLSILTIVGNIIYGMPINHPFIYSFITLFLAFLVTSWGAAIAVFSKTENTGMVMAQLIAFGGAIFGGLWLPFETLPNIIQIIGKALPQYWVHQGLMSATDGEINYISIALAFTFLIIYSLLGLSIALIGYNMFLKKSKS